MSEGNNLPEKMSISEAISNMNSDKKETEDAGNAEITSDEIGSAVSFVDSEVEFFLKDVACSDKKARVGEKCAIKATDIADLRKMEKGSFSSSKIGNFFALCTGAQMLLPNTPMLRSNPSDIAKEVAESNANKESGDGSQTTKNDGTSKGSGKKRKKPAEIPVFYCKICDSTTNSEETHLSHIQGKKHQKKMAAASGLLTLAPPKPFDGYDSGEMQRVKIEEALPPNRIVKRGCMPKVQNKLDRTDSPCIGLSYVTEVLRKDPTAEAIYVCWLCNSLCQPTTVLSHVVGYKHRLNYMKAVRAEAYTKIKFLNVKKSELTKILEEHAETLEERDGRGHITVEQEISSRQEPMYERPRPPPIEPRSQFNPSPFQVEEVRFMPAATRLDMLEELSNMNASEINTKDDASRLDYIISNFRQSLMRYKGVTGQDISSTDYSSRPDGRARSIIRSAMSGGIRPSSSQGMWRPMASREVNYPSFYDYPRFN